MYQEEDLSKWVRSYLESSGYVINDDDDQDGLKVLFTDASYFDEGEILEDGTQVHKWSCCFIEEYDSPYRSYLDTRKFLGYTSCHDEIECFKELVDRLRGLSPSRTITKFTFTMGCREWERDVGYIELDFTLAATPSSSEGLTNQ
jgi:hypothetical protein